MLATIRDALIGQAQTGCRADELRELITVIDTSSKVTPDAIAARTAFEKFRDDYFLNDLSECRSISEYDALVEDLGWFRDQLNVDVNSMIEQVEEAKIERCQNEVLFADSMEDEIERAGTRRKNKQSTDIPDIFGSMKARQ